ncbi:MAG: hypothetical protein AAFP82_11745, partial [Bacteroidota bacterium]
MRRLSVYVVFMMLAYICISQLTKPSTSDSDSVNNTLIPDTPRSESFSDSLNVEIDNKSEEDGESSTNWGEYLLYLTVFGGLVAMAFQGYRLLYGNTGLLDTIKSFKQKRLERRKLKEPKPIESNLPGRQVFVGRENQIIEINNLIKNKETLTVISGPSGSGKTSIARELAYQLYIKSSGDNNSDSIKGKKNGLFFESFW